MLLLFVLTVTAAYAACLIGGFNNAACLDEVGLSICNTAENKTNRLIDLVNTLYNRTEPYVSLNCERSLVCYSRNNANKQLSSYDRRYYGVCSSPELYMKCNTAKQRYEELMANTKFIANLTPINCQDYDVAIPNESRGVNNISINILSVLVFLLLCLF